MVKSKHVFLLVLLISLVVHGLFWQNFSYSDKDNWQQELAAFINEPLTPTDRSFYGYPATLLLMTAQGINYFGVPLAQAMAGALALWVSLGIAVVATVSYKLRPDNSWWVGVGGVLIFNRIYFAATPPSAVVSPLLVALVLAAVYLREQRLIRRRDWLLLGLLIGAAGAVRLPITGLISGLVLVYLLSEAGWWWAVVAAVVSFVIFDPYMWVIPYQHLIDIAQKVLLHVQHKVAIPPINVFFRAVILALIGIALGIMSVLTRVWPVSLPRQAVIFLLVLTLVVGLTLNASPYHPRWYFSPVILLWEVILPLFLLDGISRFQFTGNFFQSRADLARGVMQTGLLVIIVLGYTVVAVGFYL